MYNKNYYFTFDKDGNVKEAVINSKEVSTEDKVVLNTYFKEQRALEDEKVKVYEDAVNQMEEIDKLLDLTDVNYDKNLVELGEKYLKDVFKKYKVEKKFKSMLGCYL